MDKVETSERMAKAIVQSLLDNDVIRVYAKLKHYLTMNPYITKELLEKYIRESILEFMKEEEEKKEIIIVKSERSGVERRVGIGRRTFR